MGELKKRLIPPQGAAVPVRVAHIMGKMNTGGVESVVMNYYRNIDKEKVQFDFIVDEDSSFVPQKEIEDMGGKVYRVPPYKKPFKRHKALTRLFRDNKYPCVHSHTNALSVFPLLAAKQAGIPFRLAHSHSTAGKGERGRNLLKNLLRPLSRVFPSHYCACSEYAGKWLFGDKAYASGKVSLIKNAIDTSKFAFDPETRRRMRDNLNISDMFAVGHIGRFMKQKNHSFLVDIFAHIHEKQPDAVLLLVGEGELEHEIRKKVDELGINERVRFLGVRNDVNQLLMAFDVFLLPSLYEGLPVVAVEAQACGLKMVVSDVVTKEAKINKNIVYLPLIRQAKEWAEAALSVQDIDRAAAKEQLVEAGYEISIEASKLLKLYMSLVNPDG